MHGMHEAHQIINNGATTYYDLLQAFVREYISCKYAHVGRQPVLEEFMSGRIPIGTEAHILSSHLREYWQHHMHPSK
jgi:hypothetical protein